jgi:hypothetical protein
MVGGIWPSREAGFRRAGGARIGRRRGNPPFRCRCTATRPTVLRRRPGGRAGPRRFDRPGRLFLYQGGEDLFADSSLPAYDAAAAALLTERVLAFLDTVEADAKS